MNCGTVNRGPQIKMKLKNIAHIDLPSICMLVRWGPFYIQYLFNILLQCFSSVGRGPKVGCKTVLKGSWSVKETRKNDF